MADSAVVRTLSGQQRGQRPLDELAREITAGAVRLASATAAWLRLVAEFDEREGWAGVGIRSCAHWLAWQCALSPGGSAPRRLGAADPPRPPAPPGGPSSAR